jgi:hypothetical protein
MIEGSGSVPLDPDPGGTKTYGSGSATLLESTFLHIKVHPMGIDKKELNKKNLKRKYTTTVYKV